MVWRMRASEENLGTWRKRETSRVRSLSGTRVGRCFWNCAGRWHNRCNFFVWADQTESEKEEGNSGEDTLESLNATEYEEEEEEDVTTEKASTWSPVRCTFHDMPVKRRTVFKVGSAGVLTTLPLRSAA